MLNKYLSNLIHFINMPLLFYNRLFTRAWVFWEDRANKLLLYHISIRYEINVLLSVYKYKKKQFICSNRPSTSLACVWRRLWLAKNPTIPIGQQLLSRHDELKERARQLLEATKREAREKDRNRRQNSKEKDENVDLNGHRNGDVSPKKVRVC